LKIKLTNVAARQRNYTIHAARDSKQVPIHVLGLCYRNDDSA